MLVLTLKCMSLFLIVPSIYFLLKCLFFTVVYTIDKIK